MRRAAGPSLPGKTGWWTTRPASNRSAQTAFGNEKCAAWSPCRWPISRRPTLNANSPRRPGPASTPSHDVTSEVICWLAVMTPGCARPGRVRHPQLGLGPRRYDPFMPDQLHFTESDEATGLLAPDPMGLLGGFVLDQQVTVQKAFSGPLVLKERLGSIDADT